MSNFFKNFRTLRLENNLTQKQMADRLEVLPNKITHWETNKTEPSLDMLIKISHTFDISYEDLVL